MSYDEYFKKFTESRPYSPDVAKYEFSIRLASVLPSQKALMKLIDMQDNPEEINEFSHRIFDTVKDKGIDLDNILFEN